MRAQVRSCSTRERTAAVQGRGLTAVVLCACITTAASATSLSSHPIATAVKRGDCDAAINLVKTGVASNDPQAAFLGGRMLDEGVCVVQNPEAAAQFFQLAAGLGDREASLEYAAKVGLGQGAEQSYEHAGELCRAAGVDPQARLSGYSLGYACTLRSVAGRLLRVTLPAGALRPGTGSALVEFKPADATLRVLSTPQAARDTEEAIGSHIGRHRVDPRRAIEVAWRNALAAVPKPDAAHLQAQPVELSLDAETALENGVATDQSQNPHSAELPLPAKLQNFPMGAGH
jgi:hypothetical protein